MNVKRKKIKFVILSRGKSVLIDNLYFIRRTKGNVIVSIMYSRTDNKYHFVNLTKSHICSCCFNTVEDALLDMEQLKNEGKIIEYYRMKP